MQVHLLLLSWLLPLSALRVPSVSMSAADSPAMKMAAAMKAGAAANTPFSDAELDLAVQSLKCLVPEQQEKINWSALRDLYATCAHRTHKDWPTTMTAAAELAEIIGSPDSPVFRQLFTRVLEDGNWDAAARAATGRDSAPWVVLVTGLNGIRKTTSVGQPWFKELLRQALGEQFDGACEELPAGTDSFFRQLDYMIATMALEQFKTLYGLNAPVEEYAAFKEGIFARYRTIAEILGVLLVRECQAKRLNVMVETSGRDVGMYKYVDQLFPGEESGYRKLVVNFGINDIGFAERSVDTRMRMEMKVGAAALASAKGEGSAEAGAAIIRANAGGPYGSSVLAGVQADSVGVWRTILEAKEGEVGHSWLKASIAIDADAEAPWRARALPSNAGMLDDKDDDAKIAPPGEVATFEFGPPPK